MLIKEKFTDKIISPKIAARIFQAVLAMSDKTDRQKEHFWAMGLNAQNQVIYLELVSLGILTASLVHPRELFCTAIKKKAAAIIVAHNHPSGDPTPSSVDKKIAKKLKAAGGLICIKIIDNIIIANGTKKYASQCKKTLNRPC